MIINQEAVVRIVADALDQVAVVAGWGASEGVLHPSVEVTEYAEAVVSALEEAWVRALDDGVSAELAADLVAVLARAHARWHGRDEEDEDLDTLFAVAALEELVQALMGRVARQAER